MAAGYPTKTTAAGRPEENLLLDSLQGKFSTSKHTIIPYNIKFLLARHGFLSGRVPYVVTLRAVIFSCAFKSSTCIFHILALSS